MLTTYIASSWCFASGKGTNLSSSATYWLSPARATEFKMNSADTFVADNARVLCSKCLFCGHGSAIIEWFLRNCTWLVRSVVIFSKRTSNFKITDFHELATSHIHISSVRIIWAFSGGTRQSYLQFDHSASAEAKRQGLSHHRASGSQTLKLVSS